MADISYIHAADLHLDAPFAGLSRETSGTRLQTLLREATYTALDRLVRLCEARRPHFLVLSGDIYNQENGSIKAQLKLRDACTRLGEMGIGVFIAHGNHDPLSSRIASIRWPENVVIFESGKPQKHPFPHKGETLAIVHGISHAGPKESGNLAKMFNRDASFAGFQLGVLHCAVENVPAGDRYAPCSLEDLRATGLDAWALGHVHDKKILDEQPFIAYSGNIQGLHINEPGLRGCLHVTASSSANGWNCSADFHSLGPVVWDRLSINVESAASIGDVEEILNGAIVSEIEEADPATQALILRISLEGRTSLDSWLRKNRTIEDLGELTSHFNDGSTPVFIKDFEINTRNSEDPETLLAREDLLGETMRVCRDLAHDPEMLEQMNKDVCAPLFGKGNRHRQLPPLSSEHMKKILARAEYICQDILEGR